MRTRVQRGCFRSCELAADPAGDEPTLATSARRRRVVGRLSYARPASASQGQQLAQSRPAPPVAPAGRFFEPAPIQHLERSPRVAHDARCSERGHDRGNRGAMDAHERAQRVVRDRDGVGFPAIGQRQQPKAAPLAHRVEVGAFDALHEVADESPVGTGARPARAIRGGPFPRRTARRADARRARDRSAEPRSALLSCRTSGARR